MAGKNPLGGFSIWGSKEMRLIYSGQNRGLNFSNIGVYEKEVLYFFIYF